MVSRYFATVRKSLRKHTPRSIREHPFTGSARQHSSSTTTRLLFSFTTPQYPKTSRLMPTRLPTQRLHFVLYRLKAINPNKLRAYSSRRRKESLKSRSASTTVCPVGRKLPDRKSTRSELQSLRHL